MEQYTPTSLPYFADKGMNVVRLPIRWEYAQPEQGGSLEEVYFSYVDSVVNSAAENGVVVLLDLHNGARYQYEEDGDQFVLGSEELPHSSLADFWTRMAQRYKASPAIWGYGIMNEPHDMDLSDMDGDENWLIAAQATIDAIRLVDTETIVVVGGYGYSNAASWNENSSILSRLEDPYDGIVFEAHQYLDENHSGLYETGAEGVPLDRGPERLAPFVDWLRENDERGIVGEISVPNSEEWIPVLEPTLDYVIENNDVLLSLMWWAAGPWPTENESLEPATDKNGDYVDKLMMTVLSRYIP
jgi:endoglucanase